MEPMEAIRRLIYTIGFTVGRVSKMEKVLMTNEPAEFCGYCGEPFDEGEGKLFDGTYQYKTWNIDDMYQPVHEGCWDDLAGAEEVEEE